MILRVYPDKLNLSQRLIQTVVLNTVVVAECQPHYLKSKKVFNFLSIVASSLAS